MQQAVAPFLTGWAEVDITPEDPVLIPGQFHARISEGVLDPLTATAWALQSGEEQAIFVSCDLICITDELRDAVRDCLSSGQGNEIDPKNVILNATHTHTGPEIRFPHSAAKMLGSTMTITGSGVDLEASSAEDYVAFAAKRIAAAIVRAWESRASSGIAYGLGYAVIGRNRCWVSKENKIGKGKINESFSHIEGYEDHSLQLMAVYDSHHNLTGLVVNMAGTAQLSESGYTISADFWHEARAELRRRFGDHLFVLPQCSAAGELTPHVQYDRIANDRMLELKGLSAREEIAGRVADAVEGILPHIANTIDCAPVFHHRSAMVELEATRLTEEDAHRARVGVEACRKAFEAEKNRLNMHPELRDNPRWYAMATQQYRRMNWHMSVVQRYDRQKTDPMFWVEVHVLRVGEVAFATNPFELYLDYGIQIKVCSPAIQTFIVQLAGPGTYLPSQRAYGGVYGAVPGSCHVGPEGGQTLVEHTVKEVNALWNKF